MEKRRFGRSGHMSTVAIFGGAAFWDVSQEEADKVMEMVIAAGVNHIDIAPSYGKGEERVGPWMKDHRDDFFLGCKTMERGKTGALDELHQSLERLQTDHFDLYQLHAVTSMEELDQVTQPGGALDAAIEAREQGLTKYIGITGHGNHVPKVFLEALNRFDFDSVLFPVNFVQFADPGYRPAADELLQVCEEKDVGVMAIKSIVKMPWGERERTNTTWYEPYTEEEKIQQGVNFALSQKITGICMAGDISLTQMILEACQNFTALNQEEQEALLAEGRQLETIFDD